MTSLVWHQPILFKTRLKIFPGHPADSPQRDAKVRRLHRVFFFLRNQSSFAQYGQVRVI
jgi:hypothetical protein